MWWIAFVGFLFFLSPIRLAAEELSCSRVPPLTELGNTKETQLDSLLRKAITCVRSGKPELAIDLFSEMISIDPDNEAAYLNWANAYIQSGQVAQGLADLSFLINLKPTFAEAWFNRGIGYLAASKYERAIADFGETLRLKPDFARAYCNRGLALVRKGAFDRALEDLDVGIEKSPNSEMCHFARGDVFLHKEEYQKAVDDYTNGLRIKPNIGILSQRAKAYEGLGEREKALADFKAVLAKVPTYKPAQDGLKRLSQTEE